MAITPSLRHLTDLRHLVLDDYGEDWEGAGSGEALLVLSSVLSGLTSLEHLVIRGVGLDSNNFVKIFPDLIALKHLDLSNNFIGEDVAAISPVLATLTALTRLDLSSNHMWEDRGEILTDNHGVTSIAATLAAITGLLHLDLSYNNQGDGDPLVEKPLGAAAVVILGNSLPASLQWLSLDGNGISADGLVAMAPGLQRLTALEHLDLSHYILEPDSGQARIDSLQALTSCIRRMPYLKHMTLACNSFGPDGAQHLARCLEHVPALQSLELGHNQLGVDGARHLAGCLQHMPALQSLDLGCNGLGDNGVAELVDSLLALNSLTKISIRGNGLSEAVVKILKAAFNKLGTCRVMLEVFD